MASLSPAGPQAGAGAWVVALAGAALAAVLFRAADDGPFVAAPAPQVRAGADHWAFQPVRRPAVPAAARAELVRNPIDAFVLARLEEAGLEPGRPAGDRELARRAFFDLIGLPPTPEEVAAFVASDEPDKWPRLVDELLARPEYGERWGRYWLDVVRFAQTSGYERDTEKPFSWRYRDYVIEAFNRDLPYDRFVLEQIAGDELDGTGTRGLVATGFYRIGAWDSEPDDRQQAVYDEYDDVLRTIGEGFLGLTVSCARCHDHRTDPIRQEDYYALLAFVRGVEPYRKPVFALDSPTHAPLHLTPELRAEWEREREEYVAELAARRDRMLQQYRLELVQQRIAEQPLEVQEAFRTPHGERTPEQHQLLGGLAHLAPAREEVLGELTPEMRLGLFLLDQDADSAADSFAGSLPWALVARESGPEPPPTFFLARGLPSAPEREVAPRFLPVLCASETASRPAIPSPGPDAPSSGRRRALAEWIASPDHPLTARVIANRVWQGHFGRGLVATPNDFGATGSPPTHPELLDWLAGELVARGWRLKSLHRLVMGSYAYRMSSHAGDPRAEELDPGNELLWRQNLRRVEAEAIRDAMLSVSGELNPARGGRGFFPELGREALAGASKPGEGWEPCSEEERQRRSVYAFVKRGLLVPMLEVHDFANPTLPMGRRPVTTTASQALALLNGEFANRRAAALARRVRTEAGDDPADQVARLFELALARAPEAEERALALDFLAQQERLRAETPPPGLAFQPRVPARLEVEYLESLPGTGFLDGPREGWRYLRGLWGNEYNGTRQADPAHGPAALFEEPPFADGVVHGRLRLGRGSELAAVAIRAAEQNGALNGLEVVLDPPAGELRLVRVDPLVGGTRTLAAASCEIETDRWYELEILAQGPLVQVRLDDRPVLERTDVDHVAPGALGVRTRGAGLELERLSIANGDDLVTPAGGPSEPAGGALESLCLCVLNLNEFVYVD